MKHLYLISLLFLFGSQPADVVKKDLDALQGKWTMTNLEVDGKDVPLKRIEGATLVIKGNDYILTNKKKAQPTVVLRLDPSKNPKEMDMTFSEGANKDMVHKAIYKIEKDTLVIARGLTPSHERPREFATWPDTGYFVVKWQRQPE